MDLVERYGELHFGLDFYLQAQGESCPAGSVCVRTPAEAGKQARPPHTPPPPPPPSPGLDHLADAMEGSVPPRFQRMTRELCEVRGRRRAGVGRAGWA